MHNCDQPRLGTIGGTGLRAKAHNCGAELENVGKRLTLIFLNTLEPTVSSFMRISARHYPQ